MQNFRLMVQSPTHLFTKIMEHKQQCHEEGELVIDDPFQWHLVHEETDSPATRK